MADKDSGVIGGGGTGSIETEQKINKNRVLTYAAVSDMMNAHHTYVCLTGIVVNTNSSVALAISNGTFITNKTPTSAIIILTVSSDDYVTGGTFMGSLFNIANRIPLCGTFFDDFGYEGVATAVMVSAANNYTKWFVTCNDYVSGCQYINLELYLKYD